MSLTLILNNYESAFNSMLSTLNKTTIHQRCINVLLTKVYQYLNGYSFIYIKTTITYAILMPLPLIISVTNTYFNSSVYQAKQLWQTGPSEIMDSASL